MKPLISQLRWLMAAFCMLAILSSFTVVVSVHAGAESEIVEFEEIEALATRRTVNRLNRSLQKTVKTTSHNVTCHSLPSGVAVVERSERSRLNGIGTYLLA